VQDHLMTPVRQGRPPIRNPHRAIGAGSFQPTRAKRAATLRKVGPVLPPWRNHHKSARQRVDAKARFIHEQRRDTSRHAQRKARAAASVLAPSVSGTGTARRWSAAWWRSLSASLNAVSISGQLTRLTASGLLPVNVTPIAARGRRPDDRRAKRIRSVRRHPARCWLATAPRTG